MLLRSPRKQQYCEAGQSRCDEHCEQPMVVHLLNIQHSPAPQSLEDWHVSPIQDCLHTFARDPRLQQYCEAGQSEFKTHCEQPMVVHLLNIQHSPAPQSLEDWHVSPIQDCLHTFARDPRLQQYCEAGQSEFKTHCEQPMVVHLLNIQHSPAPQSLEDWHVSPIQDCLHTFARDPRLQQYCEAGQSGCDEHCEQPMVVHLLNIQHSPAPQSLEDWHVSPIQDCLHTFARDPRLQQYCEAGQSGCDEHCEQPVVVHLLNIQHSPTPQSLNERHVSPTQLRLHTLWSLMNLCLQQYSEVAQSESD